MNTCETEDTGQAPEVAALRRENAVMRLALSRSLAFAGQYLRPEEISADRCISGILGAIDNDAVAAAIRNRARAKPARR